MQKFKIGGKQRGMCFGLLALEHYCEKMGGDIEQLDKVFTSNDIEQLRAVATLIWSAMIAHCELTADDLDFTFAQVKQWVGDMDAKDFEPIVEAFKRSKYMGRTIADYYYTPVEAEATEGRKKPKKA